MFCGDCRFFGFMRFNTAKICKHLKRISVLTNQEFEDGCELWEVKDAHGANRTRIATLEEVEAELLNPDGTLKG